MKPLALLSLGVQGLLLSVVPALAQEGGVYIPEEPHLLPPSEGTGMADIVLTAILLGGSFIPSICAWSSISGRAAPSFRRFVAVSYLMGASQIAYGLARVVWKDTFELSSWSQDLGPTLRHHLRDPDVGYQLLVAGVLAIVAAIGTKVVAAMLAKRPAAPLAGARVRVPESQP